MQIATQTIKAQAEEVKGVLVAGFKLTTILAPILVGASLGLPRLTPIEMLSVAMTVLGVSCGIYWLKRQ